MPRLEALLYSRSSTSWIPALPLDEIEFDRFLDTTLEQIRDHVGLETDLLAAYYTIEKQRYPDAPASQRLLN